MIISEVRNKILSGAQAPVRKIIEVCPSLYYEEKCNQKVAKYQKIVDSLESMKVDKKEEDVEEKKEVKPLKDIFLNQIKRDGKVLTLKDLVMSQDITELKIYDDFPKKVIYIREDGPSLILGTKYCGEYKLIF